MAFKIGNLIKILITSSKSLGEKRFDFYQLTAEYYIHSENIIQLKLSVALSTLANTSTNS